MSIHEDEIVLQPRLEADYDEKAHQACYIFKPSHQTDEIDGRPKKRRKTSKAPDREDAPLFPRLLGAGETNGAALLRYELFTELWAHQQGKIDRIINDIDETAVRDIVGFVEEAAPSADGRIPTGLVVAGLDGNIQSRLLRQWADRRDAALEGVVELDSSQAQNLQTALKHIIRTTIIQTDGVEGYQDFLTKHKRLIPMNFDLELLQVFAEENDIRKVVVSISDVEAFDMSAFSDLVASLSSWSNRINFVLLLGLATTVELFEARIPTSIVRLLRARVFDLVTTRDLNYEIFRAVQADPETRLWLGPATSGVLVELTKDQDTMPESFSSALKYAYMSHFFANPLSILLSKEDLSDLDELTDLCEAIRNTDSFQKHAEQLLTTGKEGSESVRSLLNDDDDLIRVARLKIRQGQEKMAMTFEAIDAFKELPALLTLQPPANASAFDIEMEALSGPDFINSDPYISIMQVLEKLRSDHLLSVLSRYSLTGVGQKPRDRQGTESPLKAVLHQLHYLQTTNANAPIRNAYDPSHPSHAATVTQQGRVAITKQAAKLTPAEQAYTDIMDTLLAALESYFNMHITEACYTNLFMHEAFVYDLKVPLAGAFAPSPRYAIERALGRPGDYLDCECCAGGRGVAEDAKHENMPPSSILWKLWCEAGALVNVRDLWEAFRGILVGGEEQGGEANGHDDLDEIQDDNDDDQDLASDDRPENAGKGKMNDRMALALFYRSLAELKMLGFVKATKKKPGVDCLAKTSWAGL